jgi:regulator of protease activity HflC (stomatin/prohibitin superfamily)
MMDGIVWALIAVVVVFIAFQVFFIVEQQTCAIIERLGKFAHLATAGFNLKIPVVDRIRTRISLKIHQLDVTVETKTKDNVFVSVAVAVQYKVLPRKIYEAYYVLQDPEHQMRAFVFDLVRAQVPSLILDDVFSKKDDIANAVKRELDEPMSEFGYEISKALITDIYPDANVKAAMNEINAAQRLRVAATERGEADKILKVKQAEAEAEASILHGRGVAGQRQAIIDGLKCSVDEFSKSTNISSVQVMEMVLLIQYIDTLKEVGAGSKSNVVFIPHSPGGIKAIGDQIRESILSCNSLNS